MCVVERGRPMLTKNHRVISWCDAEKTVPHDTQLIYEPAPGSQKDSFVKSVEAQQEAVPVIPVQTYKLFNIYVNERNMKVFEQHRVIPQKNEGPMKNPRSMSLITSSLARNVELYELPFKKLKKMEEMQPQQQIAGNAILNRKKVIEHKREDFMQSFFKKVKIEFRLTIGEDWEDYVAKSRDEAFLWDLVHQKYFQRNSEVHQYKNVLLYTDAMKVFNVRVCFGVAMDSEISQDEQSHILPNLVQLDEFDCVYARIWHYNKKIGYREPTLNEKKMPESLPHTWHKIAREGLLRLGSFQYDDPTVAKRVVKKYTPEGVTHYIAQLCDAKTGHKFHEVSFGAANPTQIDLLRIQRSVDNSLEAHLHRQHDSFSSLKPYVADKEELQARTRAQSAALESKRELTSLSLDVQPDVSQHLMRR